MVASKWGTKIKDTKEQVRQGSAAEEVDPAKLDQFIRSAAADQHIEDEEPVPSPIKPTKKTTGGKKTKKAIGRPKKLGECVRKQFDIPVELADKLVRLAEERYGDNQTKALLAVLTGKDRLR